MMTVAEIIREFMTDQGLRWGIESAMRSLRPKCLYVVAADDGFFRIVEWPENQWDDANHCWVEAPSSQEITDEYLRHKTIAECLSTSIGPPSSANTREEYIRQKTIREYLDYIEEQNNGLLRQGG